MSLNRVIGCENQIPWHLPEDFKWFKKTTMGHTLLMGRKTFESIGRPLPGRDTIILSRVGYATEGTSTVASPGEIDLENCRGDLFVCGGGQVYLQLLNCCSDLYLTVVKREVEGDAVFPELNESFELAEIVEENDQFEIRHYRQASPLPFPPGA